MHANSRRRTARHIASTRRLLGDERLPRVQVEQVAERRVDDEHDAATAAAAWRQLVVVVCVATQPRAFALARQADDRPVAAAAGAHGHLGAVKVQVLLGGNLLGRRLRREVAAGEQADIICAARRVCK